MYWKMFSVNTIANLNEIYKSIKIYLKKYGSLKNMLKNYISDEKR